MNVATIDRKLFRLFYHPAGTLRLTVGEDRSYHEVKLYQAWPLSLPGRHISLLDARGEEIVLIDSLAELTPESGQIAQEEIRRRYLTARVESIREIRSEFGVTYWDVVTNKGDREFVIQSLSESTVWLGEGHILLVDVDGNRFEIPSVDALDSTSRALLDTVF